MVRSVPAFSLIGDRSFLHEDPHATDVRATTDCDVFYLTRAEFMIALVPYDDFGMRVRECVVAKAKV